MLAYFLIQFPIHRKSITFQSKNVYQQKSSKKSLSALEDEYDLTKLMSVYVIYFYCFQQKSTFICSTLPMITCMNLQSESSHKS